MILPSASAFPSSREGNFISAHRSRLYAGNTPLAERGLSIILELRALIGNQSCWEGRGGGGHPGDREHHEFHGELGIPPVKNILSRCRGEIRHFYRTLKRSLEDNAEISIHPRVYVIIVRDIFVNDSEQFANINSAQRLGV